MAGSKKLEVGFFGLNMILLQSLKFAGDYCVLTESVVDYFQRFKTEISQWSNHFIDAFTFLDSRYAVHLRYKTSKRQMFVLDNFYGQKMCFYFL